MMGGLATARTGGGNQTNYGETPAQTGRSFIKRFIGSNASPHQGDFYYGIKDGYIYVDDDSNPFVDYIIRYTIAVKKNSADEPEDFFEGLPLRKTRLMNLRTFLRGIWRVFFSGWGIRPAGGIYGSMKEMVEAKVEGLLLIALEQT